MEEYSDQHVYRNCDILPKSHTLVLGGTSVYRVCLFIAHKHWRMCTHVHLGYAIPLQRLAAVPPSLSQPSPRLHAGRFDEYSMNFSCTYLFKFVTQI